MGRTACLPPGQHSALRVKWAHIVDLLRWSRIHRARARHDNNRPCTVSGGWITLAEQDPARAAEFAELIPDACRRWSEPFFLVNTLTVAEPYPSGAPMEDVPGPDGR